MRNGYFRLMCGESATELKIVAPKDGGNHVNVKDIMDYLMARGITYDTVTLGKGLQDAAASGQEEFVIKLNNEKCMEVRESYRMTVSQDRMFVVARFYPPSLKGERMTAEEFLGDLAVKNITYGIQEKFIRAFFKTPIYGADVIVAKGLAPRHGSDARIEYYFETDIKAKPTLNEDGSVDFFHLNAINHCSKGDVLARLFPEDPGEYGYSVYDEKIKPRDVRRMSLKPGRNMYISEDKLTLIAETDGHVTLVDDKVFVSNVFEVENVDNSTGNIEYDGSVTINGNVGTNFSVKAKGNIEVKGVVEGAVLEAGGNIIIARGMNGMSKGVLKAEGNIISKFIENAKASAGGYISTESILHSEVSAATEITVSGKRGFITGGKVTAGTLINVKTLGSSMGADTIVEVGMDPSKKERMQQLQKQIAENNKSFDQVHPVLTAMTQKLAQGVKMKPDQLKNIQEMIQKEKDLKKLIDADTEEFMILQDALEESGAARIEVTGEVFAGTKICISDVSMVVKSSMKYCKFVKQQGDVKMTAL